MSDPEPSAGPEEAHPHTSTTTTVLFVRHGTTPTTGKVMPGRAPGLHLSDKGREEAAGAAERLAALPAGTVQAIYASTLERAQETAGILAGGLGLEVRPEPDLLDCDAGEWTGQELAALNKLPEWRRLARWPGGFRFPGGESMLELRARVAGAVDRIRSAHPGAVVVAVAHADPIKMAVSEALGSPLDLTDRIMVSTCSITAIAYGSDGVGVLVVNSLGGPLPVPAPAAAPAADGAAGEGAAGGEAVAGGEVHPTEEGA
jgi:broad specificity phosphatase PhoE